MGKWARFKVCLWNSETRQFLTRTGCSWAKIIVFYIVFYIGLGALFAVSYGVFYQTLTDTEPKWQRDTSVIGTNPGLALRPMPKESKGESILISYNKSGDPEDIQYWIDELDTFFELYSHQDESDNRDNCDNKDKPDEGKFCEFKITNDFANCTKQHGYGFGGNQAGGPCIFLKLNKIYGWNPEYYTTSTLPSKMPTSLKNHISNEELTGKHRLVWVDCAGQTTADATNMGPIKYFPKRGYLAKYFPFINVKGYVSPLVAVHFENPKRGVLIEIECKAWARNIHHDHIDRRGLVRFDLLVD